jgi:hypothetical protein
MPKSRKSGGQRSNMTSASGQKSRSATSNSHVGSRVEPSHVTEHGRQVKSKKSAQSAPKKNTRG